MLSPREEVHLPLPEKDLPKSWWNDDEASYFFSPFRSSNQNPDDKDAKINFWKPIIYKWCDHENRCSFTLSELERTFTKNQLVPACLTGVVDEMLRKHQLCEKSQFLTITPQTWSGWAVDIFIKKPLHWSLRKAKEIISKSDDEKVYIVMEAIKMQSQVLLKRMKEATKNQLLSQKDIEDIAPDMKDLEIILHWLICQNKIVCSKFKEEEIIKICQNEQKLTTITDIDIGIYTLQQTEKKLAHAIEEMENERLNAIQSAKNYAAKGMKQMAKRWLKKKHDLEKNMNKRASVLENVQSLLSRIQDSHTDAKILETYQHGIEALKSSLNHANLSEEKVSNTMFELQEVLDIQSEIQESLSQPVEDTNDQELEDELANLLLSDSSPSPVDVNIKDLPCAPVGLPEPTVKPTVPPTAVISS